MFDEEENAPFKRKAEFNVDSSDKKIKLAIPTAEEVLRLKETEALYRDTYFRSQLEELLSEISMKDRKKILLESWLKSFKKILGKVPTSDPTELHNISQYKKAGVHIPFKFSNNTGQKFKFCPPVNVTFTGSFVDDSITTQHKVVDLLIEVPKECMSGQDTRNGVWLMRRAHYLAAIATHVLGAGGGVVHDIRWSHHLGEPLRPTLLVTPIIGGKPFKWNVELFPVPPKDYFKIHAFSAQKMNIKHPGAESCQILNTLSGIDASLIRSNSTLEALLPSLPNLAGGIKLFKIWLGQRFLYQGRGCFSGHLVSMLALYLYRMRKIQRHMSAYQVFRTMINYIATEAMWSTNGINMHEVAQKSANGAIDPYANTLLSTNQFHDLFDVVFVEPTGYLNLCAFILPHIFEQVKQEAVHCWELLSNEAQNTFELLFIKRAAFSLSFDQSIHIDLTDDVLKRFYSTDGSTSMLLNQLHPSVYEADSTVDDIIGDTVPLLKKMCSLLRKGLGARATLVSTKLEAPSVWPVGVELPDLRLVTIGLKLNPSVAFNLLTKDTENDDKIFREFWGELSMLRRYRDGTICETVAWGNGTQGVGECRKIPGKIAKHLFQLHIGIPQERVMHVGPDVESILRLPNSTPESDSYCTGESFSSCLVDAFDKLGKVVRSLDIQPSVAAILSSSDALSHCRTYPRKLGRGDDYDNNAPPLIREEENATEMVVMLTQSGKWPTELEAMNSVRRQFHRNICDQLRKNNIKAFYQGLGNLMVFFDSFWFALRVTYQGEIVLMKRLAAIKFKKDADLDLSEEDSPDVLNLQIRNNILPRIASSLGGVQALHPSYGCCVRLCRRWLAAHLLEPEYFPSIVTQLVVAHIYLHPGEFQSPRTPYIGFMRFIFMLATTDFNVTPLFVDLSDDFNKLDVAEIQSRFTSIRESFPALFVSTPYDIRGGSAKLQEAGSVEALEPHTREFRYRLTSHWSSNAPTAATLLRVKNIATNTINKYALESVKFSFDPKALFIPNEDFDVQIFLNARCMASIEENLNCDEIKNIERVKALLEKTNKDKYDIELIVKYLQNYSDYIDIYYDPYGGNFIGINWKKDIEIDTSSMSLFGGFELMSKNEKPQFHEELLIADIDKTAAFLIRKVTIKNHLSNKFKK